MATPLNTQKIPPVPSAQDIVGREQKVVTQPWQQWFQQIRDKVNVITASIVALAGNATAGFLSSDGVGGITSRTLTAGTGITITNGNGVVGNPVISASASGGAPINVVNNTAANYTVLATDLPSASSSVGWVASTVGATNLIQIDTHANQAIPVGAHLYVSEEGTGQTKIAALTGVTFVGPTITPVAKGVVEAVQIATDLWHIFGNLAFTTSTSIRGLVGYWKLDETAGTIAYDSSGNNHNGTYTGTVTLGNASLLPSTTGHSTAFSSTGYVSLPIGVLNTIGYPFTIFGWGKPTNVSANNQIVCSATGGFNLFIYTSKVGAGKANVANVLTDSRTLTNTTIYFWALTVDSVGNAYVYVNGVASSVFTAPFASTDRFVDTVLIGSNAANLSVSYFQGTLQNVGICNVALTGSEISNIYANS